MMNELLNYFLNLPKFNFSNVNELYQVLRNGFIVVFLMACVFIIYSLPKLIKYLKHKFNKNSNIVEKFMYTGNEVIVFFSIYLIGAILGGIGCFTFGSMEDHYRKELNQYNLSVNFASQELLLINQDKVETIDGLTLRKYVAPIVLGKLDCGEKTMNQCLDAIKANKEKLISQAGSGHPEQLIVFNE